MRTRSALGLAALLASTNLVHGQLIAADSFLNNPAAPGSPDPSLGQYFAVAPNQLRRGEANGGGQNPTIPGFSGPWSGNVTSGTLGVAQWTAEIDGVITPQSAGYHAGGRARFGGASATNTLQRRVQRTLAPYAAADTYYYSVTSQVLVGDDSSTAGFVGAGFTNAGITNGDNAHFDSGSAMRGFLIGAATDGPNTDYVIRHVGSSGQLQNDVIQNDIIQSDGVQTVIARYTVVRLDFNDQPSNPLGNSKLTVWHLPSADELYSETAASASQSPLTFRTFALTSNADLTQLTLLGFNWSRAASFDEPRLGRTWSDVVVPPAVTWITDGDGTWSNGANWTGGGAPNGLTVAATLSSAITSPRTITLDQAVTLRSLRLSSSSSYTIAGSELLTLDGASSLTAAIGTHSVNVPVRVTGTGAISASTGASLAMAGLSVDAGASVTFGGAGSLGVGAITNDGSAVVGNGSTTIRSVTGVGTLQVSEGVALAVGSVDSTGMIIDQSALALQGSLELISNTTTAAAARVGAITFGGSGRMDVGNNQLIVDYGDASPFAAILAEISEGYQGGTWLGNGIVSAGLDGDPNEFIGIVEAGSLNITSFGGVSVDATAVLVRRTLRGDTDLDGTVGFSDLLVLAQNFETGPGKVWAQGNFDYLANDVVDFSDLLTLAQQYGASLLASQGPASPDVFSADWARARSMVPEPGVLSALLVGACLMARRRD